MKRIIGLGIGGLLALVVGLVLPHLPDSALRNMPVNGFKVLVDPSFQGAAAWCFVRHPSELGNSPRAMVAQVSTLRSCANAYEVMNLGAWLVVIGALALVVAVGVLILSRIRRRPALDVRAV